MSKRIICTVGLSNSGKSRWACQEFRVLGGQGIPCIIVNRDSLRLALYGKRYNPDREQEINRLEELYIRAAIFYGYNTVIIDACHHTRERRNRWREICTQRGWELQFQVFDTPVEECVRRAEAKVDDYIIPVIRKQAAEFEPLTEEELCNSI